MIPVWPGYYRAAPKLQIWSEKVINVLVWKQLFDTWSFLMCTKHIDESVARHHILLRVVMSIRGLADLKDQPLS